MTTAALAAIYLAAVVAANIAVAAFGPDSVVVVAFLFIGLDLTTRDELHDRWRGRRLWLRMFSLITAGGALSYLLAPGTGQVAVASSVAFVCAGMADAIMYRLLGSRSRRLRVNGSNVLGAGVDSLVFPTLAFGAFMPLVVAGQWLAKVGGGALWHEVLRHVPVRQAG